MAFLTVDFHSDVLGMGMTMNVILPQSATTAIGIASSDCVKCKTLYLLHGLSDDHTIWSRRTSIERYVSGKNLAVVMPCAHKSWYTDMAVGDRYFEYISKEVPSICRGMFRQMSSAREDNFIAGLSMGGYGAVKTALTYPESFAGCAGLSGAYDIEKRYGYGDAEYRRMETIFGPKESFAKSVNDVYSLAGSLAKAEKEKPRIFLWCGTEDSLLSDTQKLSDILADGGYEFVSNSSRGTHEWSCWDREIGNAIEFFGI